MELLSWTFLVELATVLGVIYWYASKKYSYWSSRNVPGPRPLFPFGNLIENMFAKSDEIELKWGKQFGRIYGTYLGLEPILTVADPKLVKQVMVKDFDKFVNRRVQFTEHEIWDENLFQLESEKWKAVRSVTSPSFTSGKLRGMLPLMNRTVDRLVQYLDKVSDKKDKEINAKEVMGGFTMDTIALSAFATEVDTNGDRSKKSVFLENATKFFNFNILKTLVIVTLPKPLLNLLNIKLFFNRGSFDYFVGLCRQILNQRHKEQKTVSTVKRNDLIQLLVDASIDEKELANTGYDKLATSADNEEEDTNSVSNVAHSPNTVEMAGRRKLAENEIIAQCILVMLAGYETTASTITNLLYELAINPDIQDRLCTEVSEALDGIHDTYSREYYDIVINGIPLLEATIKETLRKYPPVTRVERRVSVNGLKIGGVELYKDQVVEVSVYSIHHDEEYYPEPKRFNPDRFMPENKDRLVPYTYLPFGVGPRNCVGMRFAYQEIKLLLAQIITRYRFEPTPKTPIPLQFGAFGFLSVKSLPISVSRR